MRVIIAPDSFKGTLSSRDAAEAIVRGLRGQLEGADFEIIPLSDGGEGLVDALLEVRSGERLVVAATGPLGDPVDAEFALIDGGTTAVIEMAAASGLPLVPDGRRDAEQATTRGTGDLILAALQRGAKKLVIGIGGSATTDGGAGCAQALGVSLLDSEGRDIPPGGAGLALLDRIDLSSRDSRVDDVVFEVACDVSNRLLGAEGAAAVFGPNKGLTPDGVRRCDENLARLADVIERDIGVDVREVSGGGAAGGLGAGLVAFCGATLDRGIERVLDACGMDARLAGADLVVTGEGRIDTESAYGKVPVGVAGRAEKTGVPAVAFVGINRLDADLAREMNLAAIFSIVREGVDESQAMANPAIELERLAAEAAPRIVSLLKP